MSLIHSNLRVLMAERGLNIQKVRDQTTLSRTTISNLVNNYGSGIQFDTLKQLCELLKCQPGDLFTYIEVVPYFEVMTKEPIFITEEEDLEDDIDDLLDTYVSSYEANIKLYFLLRYEGFSCDFLHEIKVKYGIDSEKKICKLDVGTPQDFEDSLNRLKMPPYVLEYINENFYEFLINWGHDYFYNEGIEGVTNMTINRYTLPR